MSKVTRRTLMLLPIAVAMPRIAVAQTAPLRIGVLNDQSSVFSDSSGQGSVIAAQLAATLFLVLGLRVFGQLDFLGLPLLVHFGFRVDQIAE